MAKVAEKKFARKMKTMEGAIETPWQFDKTMVGERCDYLLTTGLWSDCTFVVGSKTQQVVLGHKLILAMASPVFEAMFYRGLWKDDQIDILEIEPDTFRTMLEYIYTGKTSISSFNLAWELWYAADKYQLPHLVDVCKDYIHSVVNPKNACKAYEMARLFMDQSLMDLSIEKIRTNTKEVLNDKSFNDAELKTVITVCSLDPLNVDSDLDLFHAVVRYSEAQEKTQEQSISPSADFGLQVNFSEGEPIFGSALAKLSMGKLGNESPTPKNKVVNAEIESSAQNKPATAVDLDLKSDNTEEQSDPIKRKIIQEGKPNIRTAIQKIRFLSLTPEQFADGPGNSALLSEAESYAIIMNINSKAGNVPMPAGFSNCRVRRQRTVSPTAGTQVTATGFTTFGKAFGS